MYEYLGMTLVFAADFVAIQIDFYKVFRSNFLKPEAVWLHENSFLTGNSDGHVAKYIIPVTFIRKNVARQS
jgi:hypothetical protein